MTAVNLRALVAMAGVVSLCLIAPAQASPLYFDFNQVGAADIVSLSYPAAGLNGGLYYAGQYQVYDSPNADFTGSTAFNTFCVDLFDDVSAGQKYLVNPRSTNDGLTNGQQVAYLYNTYGTATLSNSGTTNYTNGDGTFTLANSDYAAALQLAIWDELANGGLPATGTSVFQYGGVNADTLAQISRFLGDAAANSAGASAVWLDSHVSIPEPSGFALGQGFIAPGALGSVVTPEPGTEVLLGLGLVVLLLCTVCRHVKARRASAV
jgi:hypothetical protein